MDRERASERSWQGKEGIRFSLRRSQIRRWIVTMIDKRSANTWLRLIHLEADLNEEVSNFSFQTNRKNETLTKKASEKMTRKMIVTIISTPAPKLRKVSCSNSVATINDSNRLGSGSTCFSVTSWSYSKLWRSLSGNGVGVRVLVMWLWPSNHTQRVLSSGFPVIGMLVSLEVQLILPFGAFSSRSGT